MVIKINMSKCKVVSYERNIDDSHIYNMSTGDQVVILEHIDHFNDLGVLFDEKLTFRERIQQKIKKAHSVLGTIKRNF